MRIKKSCVSALLVSLMFCASTATAVEIQITSGSLAVPQVPDLGHPFQLFSQDFSLTGGQTDMAGVFNSTGTQGNEAIGNHINFGGQFRLGDPLINVLVFEGQTFPYKSGILNFSPGTAPIVPDVPGGLNYAATMPFTMRGTVSGYDNFLLQGPPLETFELTGQGTVAVRFCCPGPQGNFSRFTGAMFTFAPVAPPAVIPEPSTILLSATGLLGLAVWMWRGQPRST